MVDHSVMKKKAYPPPPQNKGGRKGKKYCHVQLRVVILISLLLWAAVMFHSNSFSNRYTESRGEVWGHVTMVAKVLNLNNLSWQRQPFALSNDGRKGYCFVLECNYAQESHWHTCHFCHFFCHVCRATDCWDHEILLLCQHDVTTFPLH